MLITIELNNEEISGVQRLARWRSDPKVEKYGKHRNSTELKASKEIAYRKNYIGLAGEFAVAQHFGAFFDPIPRMMGDGHQPDLIWGEKAKIAVKTASYDPPIFKINGLHEIEYSTDLVLCHYKEPFVKIYWIKSKEEFLDKMYTRDFGRGIRLCLDHNA